MAVLLIAAISTLILLYLSIGTIKVRKSNKIIFGDGDNHELKQWIRAHGNFVENSPFILLLLFLLEYSGVSKVEIALAGTIFIAGRISHAYSMVKAEKYRDGKLLTDIKFRVYGMSLTFLVLFYCVIRLLVTYFI